MRANSVILQILDNRLLLGFYIEMQSSLSHARIPDASMFITLLCIDSFDGIISRNATWPASSCWTSWRLFSLTNILLLPVTVYQIVSRTELELSRWTNDGISYLYAPLLGNRIRTAREKRQDERFDMSSLSLLFFSWLHRTPYGHIIVGRSTFSTSVPSGYTLSTARHKSDEKREKNEWTESSAGWHSNELQIELFAVYLLSGTELQTSNDCANKRQCESTVSLFFSNDYQHCDADRSRSCACDAYSDVPMTSFSTVFQMKQSRIICHPTHADVSISSRRSKEKEKNRIDHLRWINDVLETIKERCLSRWRVSRSLDQRWGWGCSRLRLISYLMNRTCPFCFQWQIIGLVIAS